MKVPNWLEIESTCQSRAGRNYS